jgi:hypothetical protein
MPRCQLPPQSTASVVAENVVVAPSCAMTSGATDQQRAIHDEVAFLVVEATLMHTVISVSVEAAGLGQKYPASGLRAQDIADKIIRLAALNNIAIELSGKAA